MLTSLVPGGALLIDILDQGAFGDLIGVSDLEALDLPGLQELVRPRPANPQGLPQVFDPENIGIIGKHFDFFLLFHTKSPFSMLNWLFQALIVC